MTDVETRPAEEQDLPAVVALLADDVLGAGRESLDDLNPYRAACWSIPSTKTAPRSRCSAILRTGSI